MAQVVAADSRHVFDLNVENLRFWYRINEIPIVYDLSFHLPAGKSLAVVGASGAGKTTLLRLLSGSLSMHSVDRNGYTRSGNVTYGEQAIDSPHDHFAFVAQNFAASLFPWMTCKENVLLAASKTAERGDVLIRIEQLLEACGLTDVANLNITRLSGGQQQRTAVCRALLSDPGILFLDEPFANLDFITRSSLAGLLKSLSNQTHNSLVLVTHDVEGAVDVADLVLAVRRTYGRPESHIFHPPSDSIDGINKWLSGGRRV